MMVNTPPRRCLGNKTTRPAEAQGVGTRARRRWQWKTVDTTKMTKRKERVDEEGQVAQNLMAAAGRRDDLIQEGWLGWHEFLCHPPNQ